MGARSSDEVERILSQMTSREQRQGIYERLARQAGVSLPPIGCWLLFRLDEFGPGVVSSLARHLPVPQPELLVRLHWLEDLGLVSLHAGASATDPAVELTAVGRATVDRLAHVRRERLEALAKRWHPERYPELDDLLRRLARVMVPDVTPGSASGPP
jgi:hypothetical protein